MSGFHFSSVNHALVSENPSDSINLFWNQQMEKNRANAISFFTPNFDATIGFEYPEFGMFGNNLLNPMLAIQQTMQSFQNGSWMNGMSNFGGFGNFGNFGGFGNFGFGSPWGNFQSPWTRQDGQGGSGKTAEEKLQYAQYDKMKKILNEYKKVATDSEKAYIEEAMSKSGKIDEKIKALKDVAAKLDSSVIKESLLSLDPYKTQLIKAGYKVNNNDADKTLKTNLKLAAADLKAGKVDTLTSSVITNDAEPNILNILSTWNDTHNTTSDRNIIRSVASSIPSKADEQTNHKKAVEHIAKSLLSYAENIKTGFDADVDFSQLDKSAEEVATAWATASKNFNKDNVNKLAAKVDDLYARLRLIEAEKIRNSIQKDYKFVNDMTGKTIVDDNLIIKETEKDLKAEGITPPASRDAVPSGNRDERPVSSLDDKPVDEQIAGLTQEQEIAETNVKKGIYKSKNSKDEKHHLYMKKDDKLVELKDVVSIDKDNNCKMKDGSTKKLADVEKVEVSPSEIKQYNATLKKIEELKNGGKLVKCPTNLPTWNKAGVTLYWSKGKQANGAHQCFVVMGNELMQINCKYVDKNGKIVMEDGSTKDITQLTEADCTSVNSSDILATDEPKSSTGGEQGNGGSATLDDTGEMDELAEKLGLTETGVIGYYKKGRAYYKYNEETQQFEYLKGVTTINDNGTMVKNGKEEAIREVEKPEEAGKILRKKLGGDTSTEAYTVIAKKMNSFSTYTDLEDIAKFFEAYEEERPWYALINSKMCAQIATEDGLDSATKGKYLKTIVKQTLVLAKKCLHRDSEEIDKLKEYSTKSLEKSPYEVASIYTDRIRAIDSIIETVLKKYREKFPKDATANDTKAE